MNCEPLDYFKRFHHYEKGKHFSSLKTCILKLIVVFYLLRN